MWFSVNVHQESFFVPESVSFKVNSGQREWSECIQPVYFLTSLLPTNLSSRSFMCRLNSVHSTSIEVSGIIIKSSKWMNKLIFFPPEMLHCWMPLFLSTERVPRKAEWHIIILLLFVNGSTCIPHLNGQKEATFRKHHCSFLKWRSFSLFSQPLPTNTALTMHSKLPQFTS